MKVLRNEGIAGAVAVSVGASVSDDGVVPGERVAGEGALVAKDGRI